MNICSGGTYSGSWTSLHVTDPDVQRKEELHPLELVGREDAFAERGHPQVHEGMNKPRPAEPARGSDAWSESLPGISRWCSTALCSPVASSGITRP